METEPAPSSDDLPLHRRSQNHSSHSSSHSNHSNESNININNNNNNNNSLDNNGHHQADPDLSSEDDDGDFGSADEIGSEDASAWIARASRSLCAAADSRAGGAADGIDIGASVGGGGSGGGAGGGGGCVLGVGAGTDDGPSPPLQGEVNVTLWQFLLELLMSRQYSHVIQWTNREGEFQLLRAEEVARLWGMRKNKNHRMNYDKLSRALRYYYQKNIIKKVQGQKFVYRFVGLSETALQASRSLGVAAATASIASPSDGVSPKLEAVDEDLPVEATPSPVDEPQLATQLAQPIQLQQQHAPPPPPPPPPLQQRTQSLTPPPLQPAAFAHATRRLWQCGQLLQHHQQHHHHQQQQQGLDLSLPHSTSALAAASSVPAASSSPPPHSKRLRSPESGSSVRSPADSPPAAKRPCCACRCHEPQSRQSPPVAAVSTPRVKAEPTNAPILGLEAGDLMSDSGAGGLGALPGSYIQWLTLELAGSGAGGPGGPGGVGGGAGGSAYLHSSRHAANMKKLAEHIRLQKMMKRPEPAAPSSSASPVTSAASAHSLRHPHPPSAPAPAPLPSPVAGSGLAGASALGNGSQTPFSPPGCVWMPVPVAMLSQLWAGHEAAAAAVAAASAAAAAAAAAASGAPPTSSANSTLHGNLEDHGD